MKDFKKFRQNLTEAELVQENGVALPPNILILRRQTVRQFAGHTLVALYYNDKLDQYFSIPFGGAEDSIITPSSMKEEVEQLDELSRDTLKSYVEKTRRVAAQHHKGKELIPWNKMLKYNRGTATAIQKLYPKNTQEEVEQLDELNTSTLGSYLSKSVDQLKTHSAPSKRYKGSAKAISKLNLRTGNPDPQASQAAKDALNMDEETLLEVNLSDKDHEVIKAFMNKKPHSSKKLSTDGKKLDGNWMGGSGIAHHSEHGLHLNELGSKSAQQVHRAIKKHNSYDSHSDVPHYKNIIHEEQVTEVIEENVIEHLRSIKEFHTHKPIKHGDGKQTTVDPTTAHALLTVHDALSDENKKKFAEHLGKSKQHFNKMLDFTWKSVK